MPSIKSPYRKWNYNASFVVWTLHERMQPQLFSSFPISDSYHYQNNCNIKIRFRDRNVGMCCLKTSLASKMKERKCLTEVILSFLFSVGLFHLFFFFLIYFFIFGCTGSSLLHSGFLVVEPGGYSSLWCAGFSLQWLLLLRSMGSRHRGSLVVAHALSYPEACGILLDQGSNPCPLYWQVDSYPLYHQGSPILSLTHFSSRRKENEKG